MNTKIKEKVKKIYAILIKKMKFKDDNLVVIKDSCNWPQIVGKLWSCYSSCCIMEVKNDMQVCPCHHMPHQHVRSMEQIIVRA